MALLNSCLVGSDKGLYIHCSLESGPAELVLSGVWLVATRLIYTIVWLIFVLKILVVCLISTEIYFGFCDWYLVIVVNQALGLWLNYKHQARGTRLLIIHYKPRQGGGGGGGLELFNSPSAHAQCCSP